MTSIELPAFALFLAIELATRRSHATSMLLVVGSAHVEFKPQTV
jgi:hypothetical protein